MHKKRLTHFILYNSERSQVEKAKIREIFSFFQELRREDGILARVRDVREGKKSPSPVFMI